mgnify:CR=1 FL=1
MNDQNKHYPTDWVRVQWYIELNAHLDPINSNHYHRTSIDERCLTRKHKLLAACEINRSKLENFFGSEARHEHLVLQGRRMHRQYTDMIVGLKRQIRYLELWLGQEIPF